MIHKSYYFLIYFKLQLSKIINFNYLLIFYIFLFIKKLYIMLFIIFTNLIIIIINN